MTSEIVTGEGVALDVRPAGVLSRIGGELLDMALYFAVLVTFVVVVGQLSGDLDPAAGTAMMVVAGVIVMLVIPATVETLTRGKSLGKAAAGIRIVRDDGGPIRLRHAFVRALTGVLEIWGTFGSLALITSLLNSRGKRLGDFLAGTYAVRERTKAEPAPPLFMPPPLASWAAIADIRRLPDGLALNARQFLARAHGLNPLARASLANELAAQVQLHVAPLPPAGTPPEAFLTAVLAARRDREYGLEHTAMARRHVLERQVATLPHGIPDPTS